MKPTNMTTPLIRNSINRSPLRLGFLFIPLAIALASFALSQTAQAQLPPPVPDGGYPNGNTAEGDFALQSVTSGFDNTAIGNSALEFNTTGSNNTATGFQTLLNNTTGSDNTAIGFQALLNNIGHDNTAVGTNALLSNNIGFFNTATGVGALQGNSGGSFNTANGSGALFNNGSGFNNTATGASALGANTSGGDNTANGYSALQNNTTGFGNAATGEGALLSNTTGNDNTANGALALNANTIGSGNIALGSFAGQRLTTGNNNIDIGNVGVGGESNKIRIDTVGTQRATFIAGIYGDTVASGVAVIVGSNGQLGTVVSSKSFKDEIKPMDKASEAILALKPVTFRYKHELDPDGIPQFGLVAEEVEKVNPDLVVRDAEGKAFTVRYEAVNAMLLNEFLKEHRTVQEQATTITQLKSTVAQQQKDFQATAAHQQEQIEALTAGLQRVSAQVEMSRSAPQMVLNNQ
jgi:Chaperone of endosialidase